MNPTSVEWLGLSEPALRLTVFFSLLGVLCFAETLWPRRLRLMPRRRRWPTNLAIMVVGAFVLRLMAAASLPLTAVGVALWAQGAELGAFNHLAWPSWLELGLTLLLFDLLLWGQHAAFHRYPWLWRLHRVHHADRDFDVSTALRFHPGEIALSMLLKCTAVLLLGAPVVAVLVFEMLLNGIAMFNHANLALSPTADRWIRRLIVTPDVHRVHHSVHADEHHRNFGNALAIWDRLFGYYVAAPRDGHAAMLIGLTEYQSDAPTRLWWSLWLPAAAMPPATRQP